MEILPLTPFCLVGIVQDFIINQYVPPSRMDDDGNLKHEMLIMFSLKGGPRRLRARRGEAKLSSTWRPSVLKSRTTAADVISTSTLMGSSSNITPLPYSIMPCQSRCTPNSVSCWLGSSPRPTLRTSTSRGLSLGSSPQRFHRKRGLGRQGV